MIITDVWQEHGYDATRIQVENNIMIRLGDIAEPYFNTWLVIMKWNAAF